MSVTAIAVVTLQSLSGMACPLGRFRSDPNRWRPAREQRVAAPHGLDVLLRHRPRSISWLSRGERPSQASSRSGASGPSPRAVSTWGTATPRGFPVATEANERRAGAGSYLARLETAG